MKTILPLHPGLTGIVAVTAALIALSARPASAMAGATAPAPQKPVITAQPGNSAVLRGQPLTLVVAATGYPEPAFQWRKDGGNLPGATAATYTVAAAQDRDAGLYEVVVSNQTGHVTSAAARVTVAPVVLPIVTRQPASQTVSLGATVRFEVAAVGTPVIMYQWRKDGVNLPGATAAVLTLGAARPSDEGRYDTLLTNPAGGVFSQAATLDLVTATLAPAAAPAPATAEPPPAAGTTSLRLLAEPRAVAVAPGAPAALTVRAAGGDLAYQWQKHGVPLPGVTNATFTVAAATPADMGFYSVICRAGDSAIESAVVALTVGAPTPSRLGNLAVRGWLAPGETLTAGIVRRGPASRRLLVRAVGPTLARFGVAGVLPDPALELLPAGETRPLAANDDWDAVATRSELLAATAATGAFALEAGSRDAALLTVLPAGQPGNVTLRIRSSQPAEGGQVLGEIYDTDGPDAPGTLLGLSVLGITGPGARALVPGFTIAGPAPKRVLIRAVGPGLAVFGINETLPDPELTLRANGLARPIAHSDDWIDTPELAAATAAAGAFPLPAGSRDAALVLLLPPGGYTAAVGSGFGTAGTVLVEVYDLDP